MDKSNVIHLTAAAALGAVTAYFNILMVPLVVLVIVMAIDYLTGMISAKRGGELNSRVGVLGIIKKVGYLALVGVGIVVDYLITSALAQVGVQTSLPNFFGLMVIIWLIINELISILENLGEIGVPMPPFLVRTVKNLKGKVDDATGKHFAEEEIAKDKDTENRRE